MAIEGKLVESGEVKEILDKISFLRDYINNLSAGKPDDAEGVIKDLLSDDFDNVYKEISTHFKSTFTDANTGKLTDNQTIADLNELWTTVKLLKGIRAGIATREEILGIVDA